MSIGHKYLFRDFNLDWYVVVPQNAVFQDVILIKKYRLKLLVSDLILVTS